MIPEPSSLGPTTEPSWLDRVRKGGVVSTTTWSTGLEEGTLRNLESSQVVDLVRFGPTGNRVCGNMPNKLGRSVALVEQPAIPL
jgi:hypothetical protein